jgi:hypothetical protein
MGRWENILLLLFIFSLSRSKASVPPHASRMTALQRMTGWHLHLFPELSLLCLALPCSCVLAADTSATSRFLARRDFEVGRSQAKDAFGQTLRRSSLLRNTRASQSLVETVLRHGGVCHKCYHRLLLLHVDQVRTMHQGCYCYYTCVCLHAFCAGACDCAAAWLVQGMLLT